MDGELKPQVKRLLVWANENLQEKPFSLIMAQGKVIVVVIADPSSTSFENFIAERLSQPQEKIQILQNSIDELISGEMNINEFEAITEKIDLECRIDTDPPLGQVFAILTGVMQYCKRHYKNPSKLQKILHFLIDSEEE